MDHVTNLKQSGLKACILEGDRLALDDDCDGEQLSTSSSLENPSECQLIFALPEVLVDNKGIIKLLKTAESQNRMKAIVVDEAHLVVDWYVYIQL